MSLEVGMRWVMRCREHRVFGRVTEPAIFHICFPNDCADTLAEPTMLEGIEFKSLCMKMECRHERFRGKILKIKDPPIS